MSDTVKLSSALKTLDQAVIDTSLFFEKLDYSDLPKLLKAFAQLKELKEQLDESHKIINSLYEKLSYEKIPEVLEAHGFDSVKANGRNFIVSVRINASIPPDKKEDAHTWVRETAKVPELITPTINPKSLASFAKSYFEANGAWPPEDLIKISKLKYTSIRKG